MFSNPIYLCFFLLPWVPVIVFLNIFCTLINKNKYVMFTIYTNKLISTNLRQCGDHDDQNHINLYKLRVWEGIIKNVINNTNNNSNQRMNGE